MQEDHQLEELFINAAIFWGRALLNGNYKKANMYNAKIELLLTECDKAYLSHLTYKLFYHPSPSVRLMASVYALDRKVNIELAVKTLEEIINNPIIVLLE